MVKNGAIVIDKVQKIFAGQDQQAAQIEAVHQVSAQIKPGDFVAIIGPSGCGKSTLLRMLAGLDQPTSGTIAVDEQNVTGPSRERGLVFQDSTLYPWLNVEQNVSFGLKLAKQLSTRKDEVQEFIDLVGLNGFEQVYPNQLSGGMQQRVALARALINYPKVLLFDEPFGALDAFTRMRLHDQLIKIWQKHKITMVMVTHDVEEAVYLADHIFAMTPRPAILKDIVDVDLPHPRDRNGQEFIALKEKVLRILNFTDEEGNLNENK